MTVFIQKAPIEESTASECILTVAVLVVKFYNCTNTNRKSTDTKRTANDVPRIPVHCSIEDRRLSAEVFLHGLNSICSKLE